MQEEQVEMKNQWARCWLGLLGQETHCGREMGK